MPHISAFWDSILATLGPALVGFIITRTQRFKDWRARRRQKAEMMAAMADRFGGVADKVDSLHDSVGRVTGEMRVIKSSLGDQDKVLATLLAMTLGEFEASPSAKFVCDASGRNTNVNAAYAAMLGCGREDLMDYRWRSFIPPPNLAPYLQRFAAAGADHRKFEDEIAMRRGDGTLLRLRVHALPFPPDEGPATHWVGILTPMPGSTP